MHYSFVVSDWSDDDVINVIIEIRRTADLDRMKRIRAFWDRQEKKRQRNEKKDTAKVAIMSIPGTSRQVLSAIDRKEGTLKESSFMFKVERITKAMAVYHNTEMVVLNKQSASPSEQHKQVAAEVAIVSMKRDLVLWARIRRLDSEILLE